MAENSTDLPKSKSIEMCFKLTGDAMIREINRTNGFYDAADRQGKIERALLRKGPAFPSATMLAAVARMSYKDELEAEINGDLKEDEKFIEGDPSNYKLLAYNIASKSKSGYFGVVYWNPRDQQMIIGHRGTNLLKGKDWWVDFVGIWWNKIVGRVTAAITFTYEIIELAKALNNNPGIYVQLSITGHSLGGWLAHITTFTTKYLTLRNEYFRCFEQQNLTSGYHAHAVTFDNPGCREMLTHLQSKLFNRMGHKCLHEDLDITSYLSNQNLINTVNFHVGTVYQVDIDMSEMSFFGNHTWFCHKLGRIIDQLRRDEIMEVIDWPKFEVTSWTEYRSSFLTYVRNKTGSSSRCRNFRLMVDQNCFKINVFTDAERNFIFVYKSAVAFQRDIELLSGEQNVDVSLVRNLMDEYLFGLRFLLMEKKCRCNGVDRFLEVVSLVRKVCHFYPRLTMAQISDEFNVINIYIRAFINYFDAFDIFKLEFLVKPYFDDFMRSEQFVLRLTENNTRTGVVKIYGMIQPDRRPDSYIISLEDLMLLHAFANFFIFLHHFNGNSETELVVIECKLSSKFSVDQMNAFFRDLFAGFKDKKFDRKIVLVIDSQLADRLELNENLTQNATEDETRITFDDLSAESQNQIFDKIIHFRGNTLVLSRWIAINFTTDSLIKIGSNIKVSVGENSISSMEDLTDYAGRTLVTNSGISELVARQFNRRDIFVSRANFNNHPANDFHHRFNFDENESLNFVVRRINDIDERLIFVTGKAGMGKTALFHHLFAKIGSNVEIWPLRASASYLLANFNSNADVTQYLRDVFQIGLDVETDLFNHYLETGKIVLFVDDLDEADPFDCQKIQNLLNRLINDTEIKQIWISCRSRCALRDLNFPDAIVYRLLALTENEQLEFLKLVWQPKFPEIIEDERLREYYRHLTVVIRQMFGDNIKNLTGNPGILKALADYYQLSFYNYYCSNLLDDSTVSKSKFLKFYGQIVENDVTEFDGVNGDRMRDRLLLLAVKQLRVDICQENHIFSSKIDELQNVKLSRIFIYDVFKLNSRHTANSCCFLCTSFAQYLTAIYFIDEINDCLEKDFYASVNPPNLAGNVGQQQREIAINCERYPLERAKLLHLIFFKYFVNEQNAVICNFLTHKLLEEPFNGQFQTYMNRMRQLKNFASIESNQLFVMTQLARNYSYNTLTNC